MGDRSNIKLIDGDHAPIYLYSHGGGLAEPMQVVQAALARRQRWGDSTYLARIIVSEFVREHLDAETGHGISTYLTDNEHPILCVDLANQRVGWTAHDWECGEGSVKAWYAFEEFLALPLSMLTSHA